MDLQLAIHLKPETEADSLTEAERNHIISRINKGMVEGFDALGFTFGANCELLLADMRSPADIMSKKPAAETAEPMFAYKGAFKRR